MVERQFLMHGTDVDNLAGRLRRDPMPHDCLCCKEHALEVDIEHQVVILLGYVPEFGAAFQTSVVDQDVGRTEARKDGCDEILCLGDVADIGLQGQRFASSTCSRTVAGDTRHHFFRAAAITVVTESDVGAFGR